MLLTFFPSRSPVFLLLEWNTFLIYLFSPQSFILWFCSVLCWPLRSPNWTPVVTAILICWISSKSMLQVPQPLCSAVFMWVYRYYTPSPVFSPLWRLSPLQAVVTGMCSDCPSWPFYGCWVFFTQSTCLTQVSLRTFSISFLQTFGIGDQ